MEDVSDLASRLLSGVSDEMIADAAGFREEAVIPEETPRASI